MSSLVRDWKTYRTRFLIKAIQLDAPLYFTDPLGREHAGQKGDYLVESSDGLQRIAPQQIFEDIYVPMEPVRNVNAALPARSSEKIKTSCGTLRSTSARSAASAAFQCTSKMRLMRYFLDCAVGGSNPFSRRYMAAVL